MLKKMMVMLGLVLLMGIIGATSFAKYKGGFTTYMPLVKRGWEVPSGNLALISDSFFNFDLILARPDGTLYPFKADQDSGHYSKFSPNGEYITVGAGYDTTSDTYVIPIDDPSVVLPLGDAQSNRGVQWLPDSSALSYIGSTPENSGVGLYVVSLPTLETALVTSDEISSVGWFSNSSRAVYSTSTGSVNGQSDIYTIERDGTGKVLLYAGTTDEYVSDPLSDGRIIFVTREGEGENRTGDYYIMNADGSNVIQLTNTPTLERGSTVSPDNNKILIFDDNNLLLMDTQGNPIIDFDVPCFNAICYLYQADWSADLSEIFYVIFAQNESGGQDFTLYRVRADGSETTPRLVRRDAQQLDISDDGRYMGYEADIEGDRVTVITDLTTNVETIIQGENAMRFFGWRPGVQEP